MPSIAPNEATPPLILTIDAGTSSVRGLLFDARGRMVEGVAAQERYEVRATADGGVEDDPDAAIERIACCVDAALAQAGPLVRQIGGVALDTLVSNIMAIDASGRPLTPLITYADTRNAADAEALRRTLDERAVHDRTGCLLRTSYWPARLAWFQRTQAETWRAARRWITLGEYLELRLFGQCRASYSVASWSGLFDRSALVWDAPLLGTLELSPDRLSPLVDADAPLRGLDEPFAARWPALRDVPWFPAIGDGAAANVGSGCLGPDRVALTVGTTGAVRVVLDDRGDKETGDTGSSLSPLLPVSPSLARVPAGLWCYRVDRRRALLGGATSEGGNVYAWMRETLRLGEPDEIERALAELPPDGHGLTILPFLAGERSPGWAGDVRATIHGLGLDTSPIEILRAALEAVVYRFALIAANLLGDQRPTTNDQLPTAVEDVSDRSSLAVGSSSVFVASGGGLLGSPTWMQIAADVLGRPVVASAEPEATSRGAALLALESLGAIASASALPAADGTTFTPNMDHHATYRAAIERQQQLYERFYGARR
jgi:gluconokinase